jgi:hypothetical protein
LSRLFADVRIPANTRSANDIPLVLTIGGVTSNPVTIAVQQRASYPDTRPIPANTHPSGAVFPPEQHLMTLSALVSWYQGLTCRRGLCCVSFLLHANRQALH